MAALMAATSVLTAAAESQDTEISAETETEDLGEAISEALSAGYEVSLSVDAEEPLQELISGATKNTDMSWLNNATFEGASSGNEDGGIDASGTLSLNGTELYHGAVSIDADDQTIYLVCPEFRKKPAKVDLNKLLGTGDEKDSEEGKKEDKEPAKTGEKSAKSFKVNYARLAGEASDLAASVRPEEVRMFLECYGDAFLKDAVYSTHENVSVTAGALSETISNTSVTVDQAAMAGFLSASLESLEKDPLIQKLVTSAFAVDLANTISSAAGQDVIFDGESLYKGYGKLLRTLEKEDFSKAPGFTLTYGYAKDGSLALLDLSLIYSGASADVFSLKMLSRETHTSVQFDAGLLASALIARYYGGDANGRTGLLLEADKSSDIIHDTLTVTAAGQDLASIAFDDFKIDEILSGVLNGFVTVKVGEGIYQAEFSHPEEGTEVVVVKYNDTTYVTLTAKAEEAEKAKVDRIRRKKAMEVYDQSTWDAYIKDAKLNKMIRGLAEAGMPDSIVEMLTSGEAATEKSRENTDEVDGTGEMENGEVGGADIGNK